MPTLNELGQQVKKKYPGAYDSLSDLEVGRRTRSRYPDAYTEFEGADTSRVTVRGHERGKPKRVTGGSGNLPMLGGMVGGPIGTAIGRTRYGPRGPDPGGYAGAYIGGTAGEAMRQLADVGAAPSLGMAGPAGVALGGVLSGLAEPENAPTSAGQALGRMGIAGPTQAALQFAGNRVGDVAGLTGNLVMRAGAKLTPEAAQTAIREGLAYTRGGLKKASETLGAIGRRTLAGVRAAANRGARFNPSAIATIVEQRAAQKLMRQGIHGEDLDELAQLHTKFLRDNRQNFGPQRAFDIKQTSGNLARPLHTKVEQGGAAAAAAVTSPVRQVWEQEMETLMNERLGHIVPNYHELNSRASDIIRWKDEVAPIRSGVGPAAEASRKIAPSLGRTIGAATVGAGAGAGLGGVTHGNTPGEAAIGAVIGALAGNPAALSRLAILLASPAARTAAQLGTRAVGPELMMRAHE